MKQKKIVLSLILVALLSIVSHTSAYSQKVRGYSKGARLLDVVSAAIPTNPPQLVVDVITFKDTNSDNIISTGEEALISFTVRNTGTGVAYNVKPYVKENSRLNRLYITSIAPIAAISAGGSKDVFVVVKSNQDLIKSTINLIVGAEDANGFIAQTQPLYVSTQPAKKPNLLIADYKLSSARGGKPNVGETIHLQMIVQNMGEGDANGVKLDISLPEDVFKGDSLQFSVGRLCPGDQRIYDFPFFTNSRYRLPSVDIAIKLSEITGKYPSQKNITLDLNNSLVAALPITIHGQAVASGKIEQATLHSDVDINIPENNAAQENLFALIIGNENYSKVGQINVPFARADAISFATYAEKTLGVPKSNIVTLTDATKATLEAEIDRISRIASTYNHGSKKSRIIFYYAGHGFYNSDKESVIMPVDVSATNPQSAIQLSSIYKILSQSNAERVTVFLDACFSGGSRNGALVALRGIRIEPSRDAILGNVVVMAATAKDQSALPYIEKQHGMFTYFLLKELQTSKGKIEYGELFDNLKFKVQHNSIKINKIEQQPEALLSIDLLDEWQTWRLTE